MIAADIVESWRRPRAVMRRRLAAGRREDRALALLMLASALIFLAQWPRALRAAAADPAVPVEARLAGALFATLILAPLGFYLVAALSHLAARVLGGRGTGYGARLALFWALAVVSPAMLAEGLLAGFAGPGPLWRLPGLILSLAFLAIWGQNLRVAEFEAPGERDRQERE